MEKCVMCGKGNLVRKKKTVEFAGIGLGEYKIEVCKSCGEEYYDEGTMLAIGKKAKSLGLWGLREKTRVHKAGGSFSVVIRKGLADFVGLGENKEVLVYPAGRNKLTIEVAG